MIINSILFASSFITNDYYQQTINNIEKCSIYWIIDNIEIINNDLECFNKIELTINWFQWIYKVTSWISTDNCLWNKEVFNINNIPKIWDNINYLVGKKDLNYNIISSTNISKWIYKIEDTLVIDWPWTISWDFINCEPIEKYISQNEIIYYPNWNNLYTSTINNWKSLLFINSEPQLSLDTIIKQITYSQEKLKNTQNWERNIFLADSITKKLSIEKLIDVHNRFVKIDFNIIPKFQEFFRYLGNKILLEIYKR